MRAKWQTPPPAGVADAILNATKGSPRSGKYFTYDQADAPEAADPAAQTDDGAAAPRA